MMKKNIEFAIYVSKHAPSCIFCYDGLLVFARFCSQVFMLLCLLSLKGRPSQGKETQFLMSRAVQKATFKVTHGWLCRQRPLGTRDGSMGTRQGPTPTPRLGRACRATPHGMGLQAARWLCIIIGAKLSSCVCMVPEESLHACKSISNT